MAQPAAATPHLRIAELWVYPVKSCAGVRVDESPLLGTGLEWDRCWMVVDEQGEFVSQRELPRMALIQPSFRWSELILRAPGMVPLHLRVDAAEAPCRVRVWDDVLMAYDMGDLAAQWFSDFLGADAPDGLKRLRLARFDPEARRLSEMRWTGGIEAPNQFSDGYPLLVLSTAAVSALNARLAAQGHPPVDARRFRANLLLDGLEAHAEDGLHEIAFDGGAVRLQLVKPCSRCTIPDVDPVDASTGRRVAEALRDYRRDARLQGAVTFGMNAIVIAGDERTLRVGDAGTGRPV